MSTEVGKIGLYLVNGHAGSGLAGAPTLSFSLLVNSVTGDVTGHAQQTQAVAPPGDVIKIGNVTGHVRYTGLGPYTKIVSLQGNAVVSLPPPAIGSFLVPFTAAFSIDNAWDGVGGWTLGSTTVDNVPVHADK
jgi:Domain of unknown function (DUF1842)